MFILFSFGIIVTTTTTPTFIVLLSPLCRPFTNNNNNNNFNGFSSIIIIIRAVLNSSTTTTTTFLATSAHCSYASAHYHCRLLKSLVTLHRLLCLALIHFPSNACACPFSRPSSQNLSLPSPRLLCLFYFIFIRRHCHNNNNNTNVHRLAIASLSPLCCPFTTTTTFITLLSPLCCPFMDFRQLLLLFSLPAFSFLLFQKEEEVNLMSFSLLLWLQLVAPSAVVRVYDCEDDHYPFVLIHVHVVTTDASADPSFIPGRLAKVAVLRPCRIITIDGMSSPLLLTFGIGSDVFVNVCLGIATTNSLCLLFNPVLRWFIMTKSVCVSSVPRADWSCPAIASLISHSPPPTVGFLCDSRWD